MEIDLARSDKYEKRPWTVRFFDTESGREVSTMYFQERETAEMFYQGAMFLKGLNRKGFVICPK